MMIHTILTTTDGSEHAHRALVLAADLATKYDAKLVITHVIAQHAVPEELRRMFEVEHVTEAPAADFSTPMAAALHGADKHAQEDAQIHIALSEKLLEAAGDEAKSKGVKNIVKVSEDGDPANSILRAADKYKAGMIVMGSRGLSDLAALVVGSVSRKVSHLAKCTCVLVK